MKLNVKFEKKDADKIVELLYENKIYCHGLGCFDISRAELSNIFMIIFNSKKPSYDLSKEYERLLKNM